MTPRNAPVAPPASDLRRRVICDGSPCVDQPQDHGGYSFSIPGFAVDSCEGRERIPHLEQHEIDLH
ncbi:hypothetical protein [Variovorax sp. LjRoot178]|uniref:hypothetical protein n=1 Tax=Variovorax sp. LjRoot178 TaxID=3342277 RepID=UPI003F50E678